MSTSSGFFALANLPPDLLGEAISRLDAIDHLRLWETGDITVQQKMKKSVNNAFYWRGSRVKIFHLQLPSLLNRYASLTTLDIETEGYTTESARLTWTVDILPPTLVNLSLVIHHVLFFISHFKGTISCRDGRSSLIQYYARITEEGTAFIDFNQVLPRCQSLRIIEKTPSVVFWTGDAMRELVIKKVGASLPQSLTHLEHSLITCYLATHHLPPNIKSITIPTGMWQSLGSHKSPLPLEKFEAPPQYFLEYGRPTPTLPTDLELLSHNLRSLKTFVSRVKVPAGIFAFMPSVTSIELGELEGEQPLPIIFTHCKSLTRLRLPINEKDLPLLPANIPPRLTYLSLQSVTYCHQLVDKSRLSLTEALLKALPKDLLFLGLPHLVPLSTDLIRMLPPSLIEFEALNRDVPDMWLKEMPPKVQRVIATSVLYTGCYLPDFWTGSLTTQIAANLTSKFLRIIVPHMRPFSYPEVLPSQAPRTYTKNSTAVPRLDMLVIIRAFSGLGEMTFLPEGVTHVIGTSIDTIPAAELPRSLTRLERSSLDMREWGNLPSSLTCLNVFEVTVLPWKYFSQLPRSLIRIRNAEVSFLDRQELQEVAEFARTEKKFHVKDSFFAIIRHRFPGLELKHKQVILDINEDHLDTLASCSFEEMRLQMITSKDTSKRAPKMPLEEHDSQALMVEQMRRELEDDVVVDTKRFENLVSLSAAGSVRPLLLSMPLTLRSLDICFTSVDPSLKRIERLETLETLKLGGVSLDLLIHLNLPSSITHFSIYQTKLDKRVFGIVAPLMRLKRLQLLCPSWNHSVLLPVQELRQLPPSLEALEFQEQRLFTSSLIPFLPASLTSLKFNRQEVLTPKATWAKAWQKELENRKAIS